MRRMQLHKEGGLEDRVIFLLHWVCQRVEGGFVRRIVLVSQEERDNAWRGRRHKHFGDICPFNGSFEVGNISLEISLAPVANRTGAGRSGKIEQQCSNPFRETGKLGNV